VGPNAWWCRSHRLILCSPNRLKIRELRDPLKLRSSEAIVGNQDERVAGATLCMNDVQAAPGGLFDLCDHFEDVRLSKVDDMGLV